LQRLLNRHGKCQYLIIISILFFTISCYRNREFEVNSPEAVSRLRTELQFLDLDKVEDIHFWIENDSSWVARFKTDSSTVSRIKNRLEMKLDSVVKYIWIPEDSPSWFAPSIDPKDQRQQTFIKELANRKIFVQFKEFEGLCYFANLKWATK
jgi:hypothetical protein